MIKSSLISALCSPLLGIILIPGISNAQYCSSGATQTADSECDEVILAGNSVTISNNTASTCATYSNFTSLAAADLTPGQSYSISITAGTCGGNYTKYINAWIDYNGNQIFDHPTEALGGPNGSTGSSSTHTETFNFTVPLITTVGTTRLRVIVSEGSQANNPCATPTWGETEDYNVDLRVQFDNDAGIVDIPNPGIPACQAFSDSLEVAFYNYGRKDLDSLMIGWRVNDSVMTPVQWTGTVKTLQTGTTVLNYFRNFQEGDTLWVWSYSPNGLLDSFNINDTLYYVLVQGLSGTYTVGDAASDYRSLDSAVYDLNKRGVCSPTRFVLKDTIHTWRGEIRSFNGSSNSRWVTFASASGDTSLCKIQFQSTGSSNNYVLTLNGASYLRFDSISIQNLATGAQSGVVLFSGSAHDIIFNACHVQSMHLGTSSSAYLFYSPATSFDKDLTIQNSRLNGGSRAFVAVGDVFKGKVDGITLENNHFLNQTGDAINCNLTNNILIDGNVFSSSSTLLGSRAARISRVEGEIMIVHNSVVSTSNWPQVAFDIFSSAGLLNTPNWIANNVIKLGDTASTQPFTGILLDEVAFYNVTFNSFLIESKDPDAVGLEIMNSGGNNVLNNILSISGDGKAVYYDGVGSVLKSDFNNLYTTGATLGTNGSSDEPTLANWQISTGFDKNSISADPSFNSRTDLHPCGAQTDNIGTPIAQISSDIDGVQRDPVHPDPGAYEFASPSKFNLGSQFNICNGDTFSISPSVSVNDLLIWNNTDTAFTFQTTTAGTVTVENIGQCGLGRDTFLVMINPLVDLPADTNICFGDTLTLMSNISGTALWNDGSTANSKNVSVAGRYSIEVVDTNGCFSADTIYVTRSLAVNLPSDTTICEGITVQLDPKTGAGSYIWSNGSNAPVIFVDSTGNYNLTYTDVFGCASTGNTQVSVMPLPKGGFFATQGQSNMEFKAHDTTATGYHWSFGDGMSQSGPFQTVHVYSTNGSYKVTLTISNMCGTVNYDSTLEIGTIGYNEAAGLVGVSVFPNPSSEYLFVQHQGIAIHQIILVAINGDVLIDREVSSMEVSSLDLRSIPSGDYILIINTLDGQTITNKIIVNK
jgi:hypothetical protein